MRTNVCTACLHTHGHGALNLVASAMPSFLPFDALVTAPTANGVMCAEASCSWLPRTGDYIYLHRRCTLHWEPPGIEDWVDATLVYSHCLS